MIRRRTLLCLCILGVVLLAAAPALAEEGEGPSPFTSTAGWVYRWINFGILAFGLWYAFAKWLPGTFRRRTESIAASIAEASHLKAEAERKLREAGEKVARLDEEIAEIRSAAQRDAAAEADRIRSATREEATKIELAADMEIRASERAARMELQALASRLALERAETVLRERVTSDVQAHLFRAFVENLARTAN